MITYIIDTNALISFVTDRNASQQKQIAHIFEAAAHLKCRMYCPQNVITEFIYVMQKVYAIPPDAIQTMVRDFIALPGVEVLHEINYTHLLEIWPHPIADVADAIIASLCKMHKTAILATFDKKLIAAMKKLGMPAERFIGAIRRS